MGMLVTRWKKHFYRFGLHLDLDSFIWWPWVLVAENGVNKLISIPLSSKQLVMLDAAIVSVLSTVPHVILDGGDLTPSVTACRACCTPSTTFVGLFLKLFCCPLVFFRCTCNLRCGWNAVFQCGTMVFWFCVPFLIILSAPLAWFELVFSWTCLPHAEEFTLEWH